MGKIREFTEKDIQSAEVLLRLVVDDDYRNEHRADFEQELPDSVTPQTAFVELIKTASDVQASCVNTCTYGMTWKCDCNTCNPQPDCRNTCFSGVTVYCECHTC